MGKDFKKMLKTDGEIIPRAGMVMGVARSSIMFYEGDLFLLSINCHGFRKKEMFQNSLIIAVSKKGRDALFNLLVTHCRITSEHPAENSFVCRDIGRFNEDIFKMAIGIFNQKVVSSHSF